MIHGAQTVRARLAPGLEHQPIDLRAVTVTERKASLLIDTARAFLQWERHENAYIALRAAEETAPEEVTGRPSVHRLVRELLTSAPPSIRRDARAVRQPDRDHPVTQDTQARVLSVIVCGAGPATAIGTFVGLAQERGWRVQVIATPAALDFFDQAAIEKATGSPVRSQYSKPGAPRSQVPDAIIVAPATFNTINKWALGIGDTYALGVLAEITGLDVPIVVLPFVNTALASRPPFRRSVQALRAEGVRVLLGPGGFQLHPPRTGADLVDTYPWHLALDEAEHLVLTHR